MLILFSLTLEEAECTSNSRFSISGGVAVPNSEMNNIFNSDRINTSDTSNPALAYFRPDVSAAYSLSAKLDFELSPNVYFFGGFGLTGLGSDRYELKDLVTMESDGYLQIKSTVYSINAGINFYVIDGNIGVYGLGNLSYNFIANSMTEIVTKTSVLLPHNPTDSRLGFSVGLGLEIPLDLFSIIIETRYSDINYIGKDKTEETKSLIVLEAGFRF